MLGYSPVAILVLAAASFCMVFVPLLLGLRRLPSDMVEVGCNSLAISAACHVSPLRSAEPVTTTTTMQSDASATESLLGRGGGCGDSDSAAIEMAPMMPSPSEGDCDGARLLTGDEPSDSESLDDVEYRRRVVISHSHVRWGAVKMHNAWYRRPLDDDNVTAAAAAAPGCAGAVVGHLSFGDRASGVRPPSPGAYYA